jgi:predicted transcriptional regulator
MVWSKNPTEEQLMHVFHSHVTFKVMRHLMKKPVTMSELVKTLSPGNYEQIYKAVTHLQKYGLIKVKEYIFTRSFNKTAVFKPTIKTLTVKIAEETTISSDITLTVAEPKLEAYDKNE